jgi:cardiolipin synthase
VLGKARPHAANAVTILRMVAAIPLIIMFVRSPSWWLWLLLALLGASDIFDGWLSRKLGTTTNLGIVLDPLADKLAMYASLVGLIALLTLRGYPFQAVAIALTAMPLVRLDAQSVRFTLRRLYRPRPANAYGKLKTLCGLCSLGIAYACFVWLPAPVLPATIATLAGLASAWYFAARSMHLKQHDVPLGLP